MQSLLVAVPLSSHTYENEMEYNSDDSFELNNYRKKERSVSNSIPGKSRERNKIENGNWITK